MIHTFDQISKMSLEELQIEIAKRNGWNAIRTFDGKYCLAKYSDIIRIPYRFDSPEDALKDLSVPDYAHDVKNLEAIESQIPENDHATYGTIFMKFADLENVTHDKLFKIIHDNMKIRCQSWLMWKENKKMTTEESQHAYNESVIEFERKLTEIVSETVHGYRSESWKKSMEDFEKYFCSIITKLELAELKISLAKESGFDFVVQNGSCISFVDKRNKSEQSK